MQAATAEDMAYYDPPGTKTRKQALNLRVPEPLRAKLDDVVRVWRIYAEERGEDAEQIDLTYVCVRLLDVGADGAFAEIGLRPSTPEEWARLKKLIQKQIGPK